MRNGEYTKYKGNEYRIGKVGDDWLNLCSNSKEDLNNGFICEDSEEFINKYGFVCLKKILRSEINETYKIETHAVYKGIDCIILGGTDIWLDILTGYHDITKEEAEKLGFEDYDRSGYRKQQVLIKDLDKIYEIKEPFQLPLK